MTGEGKQGNSAQIGGDLGDLDQSEVAVGTESGALDPTPENPVRAQCPDVVGGILRGLWECKQTYSAS